MSVFPTIFLVEVTFEIVLVWCETWARELVGSCRLLVFISVVVNFWQASMFPWLIGFLSFFSPAFICFFFTIPTFSGLQSNLSLLASLLQVIGVFPWLSEFVFIFRLVVFCVDWPDEVLFEPSEGTLRLAFSIFLFFGRILSSPLTPWIMSLPNISVVTRSKSDTKSIWGHKIGAVQRALRISL